MNVKCFLCKKRLFFHWLLNQKLSDDIIEQIIKLLVPDKDYLKEINDEIKIRYRCVKDISNIYEESWHLVNYGPNVNNFKEIYSFLDKLKISDKVNNASQLTNKLNKLLSNKQNPKKIKNKLNLIGERTLNATYKQIDLFLKNEV